MKFITPIILIVISLGMYFMYLRPIMDEFKSLEQEKSMQTDLLMRARELAAKRDAILVDYNSISESDVDKLNKIVPDTFNPVLFVNDVSFIASSQGLIIKYFKVDEPKTEIRDAIVVRSKNQTYKTNIITLRLQGSYSQFVRFLSNLETGLRLVDVVGLSIKPIGAQNSGSSSLEYLLEMNTYSLR